MKLNLSSFLTHLGVAVLSSIAMAYIAKRTGASSVPVTAGNIGLTAADAALQAAAADLSK